MTSRVFQSARRLDDGGPLKLALPRGALLGETLDLLDRAGFDTSEPRGPSRALTFELDGLTLVAMRPSDVPTYVEAGAADLGITGKDVIAEQHDRVVYELADLGYGFCRMVVATPTGAGAARGDRTAARGGKDRDQVPADRRGVTSRRPAGRRRSSRSRDRSSWRR